MASVIPDEIQDEIDFSFRVALEKISEHGHDADLSLELKENGRLVRKYAGGGGPAGNLPFEQFRAIQTRLIWMRLHLLDLQGCKDPAMLV